MEQVYLSYFLVFKYYLKDDNLWSEINSIKHIKFTGLKGASKELFEQIIKGSTDDNGIMNKKKKLEKSICKMKMELLDEDCKDEELMEIIEVLQLVAIYCIDESSHNSTKSEMSYYKDVSRILEIIMRNTSFKLKDDENVSQITKDVCSKIQKQFKTNIAMSGRKIDLLTEASGLEVSANEWKKNVSKQIADKQQSKNARINKAILNFWHTLPMQERHKTNMCTLSMGWIGESGYMFTVTTLPTLTETDFDNILDSLLPDGTPIASLKTKWFREPQLPHSSTFPASYPRASPTAWRLFWKASIPHRAHTLLWRLYHHKMPCKERLYQLIPNRFPDPGCVYCGGVDSEEHFVWSCPFKHEIWQTISSRFFVDPAKLTYSLIQLPPSSDLEVAPSLSVTYLDIIASVLLSLWQLHWKFIFEDH
ncbi:hypothetical protein G6F36_011790 [Rhizopus arrhizus]|nr:hypothetical protein G6F36_011790 [Rhizopus arrhizus]